MCAPTLGVSRRRVRPRRSRLARSVRDARAIQGSAGGGGASAGSGRAGALQRELLDLRRDWEELKREIRAQQLDQKWDGQPRDDRGRFSFGKKPKPEPELVSRDAAMRPRGPRPPATPAQQARLAIAHARAEEAVARVRQLDPDWPPPRSLTSADNRDDAEVMIRAKEAETREAEARFMALSRAHQDGPYTSPEPQSLREILAPQGYLVGYRYPGAGPDARTVTPAEFENIRTNLMVGARQVEPDARYEGVWYKREDGAIFGLRLSADQGLTLDVVQSNHPLIRDGLRIHQR